MAVFTPVTEEQAALLMSQLGLGELTDLRGIEGGIENTNYFATTDLGEYVLTLFERLNHEQLPFYLFLMKHLAEKGIPVPNPAANQDGDILHTLCDKPAAVVNRLLGKSQLAPDAVHCAEVGAMLARMHFAGEDYNRSQPNLRGLAGGTSRCPWCCPSWMKARLAFCKASWPIKITLHKVPLIRPCPKAPSMPTSFVTT